ncbi:MAG: hypothetical protein M1837_002932 [Sclerophora amabilis]|nr:MAG: hypothetical protein M1837_002932 [Sclerophora amabilis]
MPITSDDCQNGFASDSLINKITPHLLMKAARKMAEEDMRNGKATEYPRGWKRPPILARAIFLQSQIYGITKTSPEEDMSLQQALNAYPDDYDEPLFRNVKPPLQIVRRFFDKSFDHDHRSYKEQFQWMLHNIGDWVTVRRVVKAPKIWIDGKPVQTSINLNQDQVDRSVFTEDDWNKAKADVRQLLHLYQRLPKETPPEQKSEQLTNEMTTLLGYRPTTKVIAMMAELLAIGVGETRIRSQQVYTAVDEKGYRVEVPITETGNIIQTLPPKFQFRTNGDTTTINLPRFSLKRPERPIHNGKLLTTPCGYVKDSSADKKFRYIQRATAGNTAVVRVNPDEAARQTHRFLNHTGSWMRVEDIWFYDDFNLEETITERRKAHTEWLESATTEYEEKRDDYLSIRRIYEEDLVLRVAEHVVSGGSACSFPGNSREAAAEIVRGGKDFIRQEAANYVLAQARPDNPDLNSNLDPAQVWDIPILDIMLNNGMIADKKKANAVRRRRRDPSPMASTRREFPDEEQRET